MPRKHIVRAVSKGAELHLSAPEGEAEAQEDPFNAMMRKLGEITHRNWLREQREDPARRANPRRNPLKD